MCTTRNFLFFLCMGAVSPRGKNTHYLFSAPHITEFKKSQRIRWMGCVIRMVEVITA